MARAARAPEQISAMIRTDQHRELNRIADQYTLSFSDVLRQTIDVGLPTMTAKYPPAETEEERAAKELQRLARRG